MREQSFVMPDVRRVLCDVCGKRKPSFLVSVVGRKLVCDKCCRDKKFGQWEATK